MDTTERITALSKQGAKGNQPVHDDRDVDMFTEDLADAEARYEALCDLEEVTEDELLEAMELYKFLYPDVEQA